MIDLPNASGVYLLKHRVTGDAYVGSAKMIRMRCKTHLRDLRDGRHQNERLTALAACHGVDFACSVLELTGDHRRFPVEQKWITRLRPTLNMRLAHGNCDTRRGPAPGYVRMAFDLPRDEHARLKVLSAISSRDTGTRITMGDLLNQWTEEGIVAMESPRR